MWGMLKTISSEESCLFSSFPFQHCSTKILEPLTSEVPSEGRNVAIRIIRNETINTTRHGGLKSCIRSALRVGLPASEESDRIQ